MKDFKYRPSDHVPIHRGSVLSVTSNRDAEDIPMDTCLQYHPLAMRGRRIHVQGQPGVDRPDP